MAILGPPDFYVRDATWKVSCPICTRERRQEFNEELKHMSDEVILNSNQEVSVGVNYPEEFPALKDNSPIRRHPVGIPVYKKRDKKKCRVSRASRRRNRGQFYESCRSIYLTN